MTEVQWQPLVGDAAYIRVKPRDLITVGFFLGGGGKQSNRRAYHPHHIACPTCNAKHIVVNWKRHVCCYQKARRKLVMPY